MSCDSFSMVMAIDYFIHRWFLLEGHLSAVSMLLLLAVCALAQRLESFFHIVSCRPFLHLSPRLQCLRDEPLLEGEAHDVEQIRDLLLAEFMRIRAGLALARRA